MISGGMKMAKTTSNRYVVTNSFLVVDKAIKSLYLAK